MKRALLVVTMVGSATTAVAVPPPPPLVTSSTASITLRTAGGGGPTLQTVDFTTSEIQDRDPAHPVTVKQRRKLAAGELANLRTAWRYVFNAERVEPSEGPPPGGAWQYEVVDSAGKLRLVSRENGAPKGQHYISIDADTGVALRKAWPAVAPKKR